MKRKVDYYTETNVKIGKKLMLKSKARKIFVKIRWNYIAIRIILISIHGPVNNYICDRCGKVIKYHDFNKNKNLATIQLIFL